MPRPIRIAARAIILLDDKLLLVNAYPGAGRLWCAPGGGADPHSSLPDNLAREVAEETGLTVAVGAACLINEFHDRARDFHQIDLYFRCEVIAGQTDAAHIDPEGVVDRHIWANRDDIARLSVKPDSLAAVAWGDADAPSYDPLEQLVPPG